MNNVILEARPSWWNYITDIITTWIIVFILFILALAFVIPESKEYSIIVFVSLFIIYLSPVLNAFFERKSTVLRVYEFKLVLEKGIFSKHIKEISISDVRMLELQQKFWQRLLKIGNIAIATAGTAGYELVVAGLNDPADIISTINNIRHST